MANEQTEQISNSQAAYNFDQELVLKSITALENLLREKKGVLRRSFDLLEKQIQKNDVVTNYFLAFTNAYNAYAKIVDEYSSIIQSRNVTEVQNLNVKIITIAQELLKNSIKIHAYLNSDKEIVSELEKVYNYSNQIIANVHVWEELIEKDGNIKISEKLINEKSSNLLRKIPTIAEISRIYINAQTNFNAGFSILSSVLNKVESLKSKFDAEGFNTEMNECRNLLVSLKSYKTLNQTNVQAFLDALAMVYSTYITMIILAEDIVKSKVSEGQKSSEISEEEIEQNDIINMISDIIASGIEYVQEESVELLLKVSNALEANKSKNADVKRISNMLKDLHDKFEKKKLKKKRVSEKSQETKGFAQISNDFSAKNDQFLKDIIETFEVIEETTEEIKDQVEVTKTDSENEVRSVRKWTLETEFTNIKIGELFNKSEINVSREIVSSLKDALIKLSSIDNEEFTEGILRFKDLRRGIPQPRRLSLDPVLKLVANTSKNLRSKVLEGNAEALKLVFEIAVLKIEHYQSLECQSFLLTNQQKIEESIENGRVILQMLLNEWISKLEKHTNDIDIEFLINFIKSLATRNRIEAFDALYEFTFIAKNNEELKQKVPLILNDVIMNINTNLLLSEWNNLSKNECCKKYDINKMVFDKILKNLKVAGYNDYKTEKYLAQFISTDLEEHFEQTKYLINSLISYALENQSNSKEYNRIVKIFARAIQVNPLLPEIILNIITNQNNVTFARKLINDSQEFLRSNESKFLERSYEHLQVQKFIESGHVFLHGLTFDLDDPNIIQKIKDIINTKSPCTCFAYNEKSTITEFNTYYGVALLVVEGTIYEWDSLSDDAESVNLPIDKFISHSAKQLELKSFNSGKERIVYNMNSILIGKQKYLGFVIFDKESDKILFNRRMITDSRIHKVINELNKEFNFPVYVIELPSLNRKLANFNPMYERFIVQKSKQVNEQTKKVIEELQMKKSELNKSSSSEIDSVISQQIQQMVSSNDKKS